MCHTPHVQPRERECEKTWVVARVAWADVGRDTSFVIRIRARGRGGVGSAVGPVASPRVSNCRLHTILQYITLHVHGGESWRSHSLHNPCSSRENLTSEHFLCCEYHLAPSKISGARCTVYSCSTYYRADRRGLARRSERAVAHEQSG